MFSGRFFGRGRGKDRRYKRYLWRFVKENILELVAS